MASRIDPLLSERAPWIARGSAAGRGARALLDRLLGHGRTLRLAETLAPLAGDEVLRHAARMITRDVTASGIEHIPAHGPALIVATHPTGIADGLALTRVLAARRSDAFFYANADILRVMPQLEAVIAPVEWRPENRSHAKARATMACTRTAFADGRLGVIFPSGRLARRRGLTLHERPWMPSAAGIARKFDLDVIPVHVDARNSALFYLFDLLHPTLRDITLFHETLNKGRMPYRVTVGPAIPARSLPPDPRAAISALRAATLGLAPPPRLHRRPRP
ncbi:glycerol acyltransferase, partial [Rhodobacterales bacterium HKCCSP123]|nr:glycerol acyltransferase [Rhodobacterales bacterium HKCCSP123]